MEDSSSILHIVDAIANVAVVALLAYAFKSLYGR
jgi:hypothetical protein